MYLFSFFLFFSFLFFWNAASFGEQGAAAVLLLYVQYNPHSFFFRFSCFFESLCKQAHLEGSLFSISSCCEPLLSFFRLRFLFRFRFLHACTVSTASERAKGGGFCISCLRLPLASCVVLPWKHTTWSYSAAYPRTCMALG